MLLQIMCILNMNLKLSFAHENIYRFSIGVLCKLYNHKRASYQDFGRSEPQNNIELFYYIPNNKIIVIASK